MKKILGIVVSSKMAKTAVVKVGRWVTHPIYKKRFIVHRKYHADNSFGAKSQNTVRLVATRPLSKTKRWKIVEIVKGSKNN